MLKKVIGVSIAVASLFAFSINNKWEVGIGAGYMHVHHGDNVSSKEDISGYGLGNIRIGKYLPYNNIIRLEGEYGKGSSDYGDLSRALLNIEHYFPIKSSKLTPYVYLGGGTEWTDYDDNDKYDASAVGDVGLGAKYAITKRVNLFAEARALRDFSRNENHYGGIIGVNYEFGKPSPSELDTDKDGVTDDKDKCPATPQGVKVDANGCPLDSDNDGVADYLDKCPNTPSGVQVDANGCPLDSDNDGVADYLDKCPNTPSGMKVDANGCPLDSDNDGVTNDLDKCPNTPSGVHVTEDGCPVTYNFVVHFKFDSTKIVDEDASKLDEFVEFLKENPAYDAEIQGYTDNRGSKYYNIKLSEKRAKLVYNYLIKKGISADRLSFKGCGPANPIADNKTKEGRKQNRRVVAKLILQ